MSVKKMVARTGLILALACGLAGAAIASEPVDTASQDGTAEATSAVAINLAEYDDAELIALLAAVQDEIALRGIEKTASIEPGRYIVGVDIPVGSYEVSGNCPENKWTGVDWGTPDGEGDFDWTSYSVGFEESVYVGKLAEGDALNIRVNPAFLTIVPGVVFK